ncbi:MAG: sulfate reduction electron transfer complex DsrMKJOP subunit DsrM [Thermodesulfobacteriota bacterium]|nr:sulfate reduction electron transfer complex DsrMKJOP subunit DsrM [Thermodesulfobacteriota bacterium]
MNALYSLFAVFVLVLLAMLGAGSLGWHSLFGVVIPYVALAVFFVGFVAKVLGWARTPVPFRIPTTAGQQKSLDWIKYNKIDNPVTSGATFIRMVLEVLLFRSLFRNLAAEKYNPDAGVDVKIRYASAKWLWLFAILFHYSFLVIVVRHLRLFTEPVPIFLKPLEFFDGILQLGIPTMYTSDIVILLALTLLLLRRIVIPNLRYISLPADYFPLFLIMGIGVSGVLMRYFIKTNIISIKELAMGLATFQPVVPEGIGTVFYVHVFLVSILLVYFPFSKLMHLGGVFLSPTRNLPNDSRRKRHINPWNDPTVKPHSYADYEDEFREPMAEAGIRLERGLDEAKTETAE